VLTTDEILDSEAVAMTFAAKSFPGLFWLMPFFVACSTLGTLNTSIMSTSRQKERDMHDAWCNILVQYCLMNPVM
jgi:hypothetical protein